jgi:predicted metalloendopeptidase
MFNCCKIGYPKVSHETDPETRNNALLKLTSFDPQWVLAHTAYHKSLGGKEAPVIDGFTGDQRFFLAFARVWAQNQPPEAVLRSLATNPHPLNKHRVNATLQNMPEFHAAFGCKQGDAMVRPVAQQCRLW